ncbi:hypothetical protein [Candidatus Laterigemmans baculatus]|uniref:hypothetical protein n=1 Tax=Candidatus Laterigemmans baculatus TaxID=2770505 RepID=UPI0013DA3A74|nr:hypothetical protein [Candidatus Laterigemmans baculatus]
MDDLENVELDFRIEGDNVHPDTVPLRDLLRAVQLYERAVRIASNAWDKGVHDELYLVQIEDKSASLVLRTSPSRASVVERLHHLIAVEDLAKLPEQCTKAIEELAGLMAKRAWNLSVGARGLGVYFPAIPRNFKHGVQDVYREETTLYANLRSVDVDNLAATIHVSGGKVKARVLNETVAKKLGAKLKTTIELSGRAEWDTRNRMLVGFLIREIGEYEPADPLTAFAELAAASGGRWDTVDPDRYAKAMRQE